MVGYFTIHEFNAASKSALAKSTGAIFSVVTIGTSSQSEGTIILSTGGTVLNEKL